MRIIKNHKTYRSRNQSELSEREVIETEIKLEMTMIYWELFEIAKRQVTVQTQKKRKRKRKNVGDMNTESALENKTSLLL